MKNNPKIIEGRDAWAAIRGFQYQVLETIIRWLSLPSGSELLLEAGEDIDTIAKAIKKKTLTQVKLRAQRATLASIRTSLANAAFYIESQLEIDITFEYLTTSTIGSEKSTLLDGFQGIPLWQRVQAAEGDDVVVRELRLLRDYLLSLMKPRTCKPEAWAAFQVILHSTDKRMFEYVKKTRIITGARGPAELKREIARKVKEEFPDVHTRQVMDRLFYYVFDLLSRSGKKILNKATLKNVVSQSLARSEVSDVRYFEKELTGMAKMLAEVSGATKAIKKTVEELKGGRDYKGPIGEKSAEVFDDLMARMYPDWKSAISVPRQGLEDALDSFYASNKAVFVLVGESGEGKTHAMLHEAFERLKGKGRLKIPASVLLQTPDVSSAVLNYFKEWAGPERTDIQVFADVREASEALGAPFVLIADDILPQDSSQAFSQKLSEIVSQAGIARIKIVLVARRATWDQLTFSAKDVTGIFLEPRTIASPDVHGRQIPQFSGSTDLFSFVLKPLADSELKLLLERRLGTEAGLRVFRLIQSPQYAILRNAFLLDKYLDLLSLTDYVNAKPLSIDEILRGAINKTIEQSLESIGLLPSRASTCERALASVFWDSRRSGVAPETLAIQLSGLMQVDGDRLVRALQREGLLTDLGSERVESPYHITFAQPRMGEYLLAHWRLLHYPNEALQLLNLEPRFDTPLGAAIARIRPCTTFQELIAWAEGKIEEDSGWVSGLASGLAERIEDDPVLQAFLIALANTREKGWIQYSMKPLGLRVYHSSLAKQAIKWLYLSAHNYEAFLGEQALSHAISVEPEWALSIVKTRLRIATDKDSKDSIHNRETVASQISGALEPLKWVASEDTARMSLALVKWLEQMHPLPARGPRQAVLERYDEALLQAKGTALRHAEPKQFDLLISDLGSPDFYVRDSAALALFPVVVDEPQYPGLRDAVIAALRDKSGTTVAVLHLGYTYAANGDLEIANAIEESGVLNDWKASLAYTELGLLAKFDPSRIAAILSKARLKAKKDGWIIGEQLALAWLRVGLNGERALAASALEALGKPKLRGLEKKLHCFAYRAATAATLCRILLEVSAAAELIESAPTIPHYLAHGTNQGFSYVDFEDILLECSDEIAIHPLLNTYLKWASRVISEVQAYPYHPIDRTLFQWSFRVAQLCATELSLIVPYTRNPIEVASKLPGGFPIIRTCTHMIELGISADLAKALAQKTIESESAWPRGDMDRDKEQFSLMVGRVGKEKNVAHIPARLHGRALARRIAEWNPTSFASVVETLEQCYASYEPTEFFFEWPAWASYSTIQLLARSFAVCLPQRPLTSEEVRFGVDCLRAAADRFPTDSDAAWTAALFERIGIPSRWAKSVSISQSLLPTIWGRSCDAACRVLRLAAGDAQNLEERISEVIVNSSCIHFDDHIMIRSGGITTGTGLSGGTVLVPPALRLCAAAVGHHLGIGDVISQYIVSRQDLYRIIEQEPFRTIWNDREAYDKVYFDNQVKKGLKILADVLPQYWHLPEAQLAYASVCARGGLLQQALSATTDGLKLRLWNPDIHVQLLYEQACINARLGKEKDCERDLRSAIDMRDGYRLIARQDEDFASVRNCDWFQELVRGS